jgi:hypothetical protein
MIVFEINIKSFDYVGARIGFYVDRKISPTLGWAWEVVRLRVVAGAALLFIS